MRKSQSPRKTKGFTIVEVVIVLAIAGLITTIVLLAVGSAERSSRDTKRIQDVLTLSTALEQFAQNNNGSLPISGTDVTLSGGSSGTLTGGNFCSQSYLNCGSYNDPSSAAAYNFFSGSFTLQTTDPADLVCGGAATGTMQVWYPTSRTYKIQMCLERGLYRYTPQ